MEDKRMHLLISIVFTIPFVAKSIYFLEPIMIIRYSIMLICFFSMPDLDKIFKFNHRNWFFHSIIIPILFTYAFWGIHATSFSIYIFSIHLITDIFQKKGKKPIGYYRIHFGSKRLSATGTRLYFLIQGVFGIIVSICLDISRHIMI